MTYFLSSEDSTRARESCRNFNNHVTINGEKSPMMNSRNVQQASQNQRTDDVRAGRKQVSACLSLHLSRDDAIFKCKGVLIHS